MVFAGNRRCLLAPAGLLLAPLQIVAERLGESLLALLGLAPGAWGQVRRLPGLVRHWRKMKTADAAVKRHARSRRELPSPAVSVRLRSETA
jgi:hypothetical protein